MDFLDPAKKKANQRRLFIGYFLVGIALLLGSIILYLVTFGYDVDRKTGQVIQNGLIFVDASPEEANIIVNGKDNGQTDKRLVVPAGTYDIELKREGYRTWKRKLSLEGSSVERLNYPVLFPDKLITKDLKEFAAQPAISTQSPDRRWMVVSAGQNLDTLIVVDANDKESVQTTLSMPKDLATSGKAPESYEVTEWSNDNRHILIKHVYSGTFEYLMIDRENPSSSLNISKALGVNPPVISLRDKKFDQLYLFDSSTGLLMTADLKTKQILPLMQKVISYKSFADNTLLYAVHDSTDPAKVKIIMRDDNKDYPLREGLETDTYLLDIARYDDHWYLAVATKGKVYIYRDPMNAPKADDKSLPSLFTTLIMENPNQLVFSANTRFIMTQSGSKFAIYDAETNKRHYFTLDIKVADGVKATWMDGHRILLNQDGKVFVMDYDGINRQNLVPIITGTKIMFDRDYTRLYTMAPSSTTKDKPALTRTDLKINL